MIGEKVRLLRVERLRVEGLRLLRVEIVES